MLIIANWKAYVDDIGKAKALVAVSRRIAHKTKNTIVLAPPAPFLKMFTRSKSSAVAFAAQDVSVTTGGAHTAEITARAFAGAGVTYAIIGHSERRIRGDTDAVIAEKIVHALANALIPVLCVGEQERDIDGRYLITLREQITRAYASISARDRGKVVVAYEPVWAIGKNAASAITHTDLAEMVLYIRKVLAELLPGQTSAQSLIIYGGSVEPQNIRSLANSTGVNGFLVGHASVDPRTFAKLVRALL